MNALRASLLSVAIIAMSTPSPAQEGQSFQAARAGTTPQGTVGGPYVPSGTLYDNLQNNGLTSLASQNSSGTVTARSADDFLIPATGCESGEFDITRIRIQMVQANARPQPFGLDLFNDDGTGNAPEAGINPFATYAEDTQTPLGPFGAATSLFEASFDVTGLVLQGDTVYWISGYGQTAEANSTGFNNFFAASDGASGSTANGVIIAPGGEVPDWTSVALVIGPPALAFSFAIDGTCADSPDLELTLSANPSQVAPGEPVTFEATVANTGPGNAQDVEIAVALGADVLFSSANASFDSTCVTPAVGSNGNVICTWPGATSVAATRSVQVVAYRDTDGPASATATASTTSGDPAPENNQATASTNVVSATAPVVANVPINAHIALLLLAALLAVLGWAGVRRKL